MVKPMWKKENWRVLYFLSFPDLWLCSFQRSFYGVLGLPVSLAFGKNYQMSDFGTVKKTVQCALKINNGLKSLIRGREEVDMKYHHLAPSFLNSNYFLLYISWNKKRYQTKISNGVLGLPVSLAFGKNYQMSDFGTVKKTVQCALKINNGLKSLIRGREEVDMKYHHLAPSFLNSNYFLLYISWNKKRYQTKISEVDRPLFLL